MTNSTGNVRLDGNGHLDGASYFSVSEGQGGASTWPAAYDRNPSIIFDLAMTTYTPSHPGAASPGCWVPDHLGA